MIEENWKKRMDAQIAWDVNFEAREWVSKIPYLSFPADVEFKAIPPFGGAVSRFMVKKGEKSISCYLDCYSSLGAMDQPYFEIFPYKGDTYRCYLDEGDQLTEKIMEELNCVSEDEHIWE